MNPANKGVLVYKEGMQRMTRMPALAASLIALVALAGCTSTESALDPSAIAQPEQPAPLPAPGQAAQPGTPAQAPAASTAPPAAAAAPSPGTTQPPAQAQAPVQNAALVAAARVHFAPIIGATVTAVAPFNQQIAARARERKLQIVPAGDASATHVMKGYFSAITEGRDTLVIYVWDVVDPAGNRVHRIQGQERAPQDDGEGWAAVPPQTMQAVANRTVDELTAWLGSRPG